MFGIFARICIGLYLLVMFAQLFVLSDSYEFLILREVDDLAFHHSLRKVHKMWSLGEFGRALRFNDYAYGALFWNIHALLTLPAFLLKSLIGEQFLIVMARGVSLIFTSLGVTYIYRILKNLDIDEDIRYLSLLFLLSFPTLGYFSQRFGTVAMVFCFSAMSIYYALNLKSDKDSTKKLMYSFALCVGTKLSGILIAPIIFFIGLTQYTRQGHSLPKSIKMLSVLGVKALLLASVFMVPGLYAGIIKREYATKVLNIFKYQLGKVQSGLEITLFDNFRLGVLSYSMEPLIFLAIVLIVGFCLFKYKKIRKDLMLIFTGGFLFLGLLLAFKIKMGPSYIGNYSSSFSFFLVISLAMALNTMRPYALKVGALLIILNVFLNWQWIAHSHYSIVNYFNQSQKESVKLKVALIGDLKKEIPNEKSKLLIDHRLPAPYTPLSGSEVSSVYLFENTSNISSQGPYDYILLSKESSHYKKYKDSNGDFFLEGFLTKIGIVGDFNLERESKIMLFYKKVD